MPMTKIVLLQNSWTNSETWTIHWIHAANLPFNHHFKQTISAKDRRCPPSSRICSPHQWRSQPKVHINEKNLSTSRIRVENTYPVPYQNINIRQRNFSYLLSTKRSWTHLLGANKPTIIMTDSKSVTKLFQTKMILPQLWNPRDFVSQFNLVIAHFPGKMNTADPDDKIIPKLREHLTVKPTEVKRESTGIAPGEPVFNNGDDLTEIPEQELWQRKTDVRNTTSSQTLVITVASYYHIDLPEEPSIRDMAHLNKPSRIPIQQDSDPTLLNFQRETLGLRLDDPAIINDEGYMHNSRNRNRIILKDDILYRQYYNEVGSISRLQLFLHVQLLAILLKSLRGKHSGISQILQKYIANIISHQLPNTYENGYNNVKHA